MRGGSANARCVRDGPTAFCVGLTSCAVGNDDRREAGSPGLAKAHSLEERRELSQPIGGHLDEILVTQDQGLLSRDRRIDGNEDARHGPSIALPCRLAGRSPEKVDCDLQVQIQSVDVPDKEGVGERVHVGPNKRLDAPPAAT